MLQSQTVHWRVHIVNKLDRCPAHEVAACFCIILACKADQDMHCKSKSHKIILETL